MPIELEHRSRLELLEQDRGNFVMSAPPAAAVPVVKSKCPPEDPVQLEEETLRRLCGGYFCRADGPFPIRQ